MFLNNKTEVWWVVNPRKESVLGDVCFHTSLQGIQYQAIGNRGPLEGLSLYIEEDSAKADAQRRLKARDAYEKALEEAQHP